MDLSLTDNLLDSTATPAPSEVEEETTSAQRVSAGPTSASEAEDTPAELASSEEPEATTSTSQSADESAGDTMSSSYTATEVIVQTVTDKASETEQLPTTITTSRTRRPASASSSLPEPQSSSNGSVLSSGAIAGIGESGFVTPPVKHCLRPA